MKWFGYIGVWVKSIFLMCVGFWMIATGFFVYSGLHSIIKDESEYLYYPVIILFLFQIWGIYFMYKGVKVGTKSQSAAPEVKE